ncbi:FecR domain-containing protein [Arcobacteraceae bacterium]|nr:FecR domain-containing protein [Arcobacteraceae bacterium]
MKKYLLLLILPLITFANVGKITALKGEATIQRGAQSIDAKSGQILNKKDLISTSKNSKLQVVFNDNTVFTIGQNSTLDIEDFLYDEKESKNNKAQLNVFKGAFSTITGRIGKLNKSKFKLKTKSASIGIRGTIVKANQEIIMCTSGAIRVTTNNGSTLNVNAGYKTNVSSGVPTTPTAITSLDIELIESNGDEQDKGKKAVKEKANDAQDDVKRIKNETEDTTLTGSSISTDGTTQTVTMKTKEVAGTLIPESSSLVITDDTGAVTDQLNNEVITWGHWADDTSKKWVAGQATSAQTMDNMRNATSTVNAEYNGQAMGTTNNGGDIKIDANNQVQINFSLGGGQNSMNGTMKFDTQGGQTWNSTFNGDTTGNTFTNSATSGSVVGTGVSGGTQAIQSQSGNIKGTFYGSSTQSVGGTFNINSDDSNQATGVFKATK